MRWLKKLIRRVRASRRRELDLFARAVGPAVISRKPGIALVSYARGGVLDYAAYVAVQAAGNRRKLGKAFAKEAIIREIAAYVSDAGFRPGFVLCHGTRNGAEQRFFKAAMPDATVLGTEISDTALRFPDTIQWDFHEVKPEWVGAVDLIYSNSWDHTYDPEKLFAAWVSCLSTHGLMVLEHSPRHTPEVVNGLDPFGATAEGLIGTVTDSAPARLRARFTTAHRADRQILVFERP